MNKLMSRLELKKWISYLLLGIAIIVSYKSIMEFKGIETWFTTLFEVLSPFFAGFIIAYLLNIPCSQITRGLENHKNRFLRQHARALSVLLTYINLILLIYILLSFVVPSVYNSGVHLMTNMPIYVENAGAWMEDINNSNAYPILDEVKKFLNELSVTSILKSIGFENIKASFKAVLGISSFIFKAALAIISSIYFLLEAKKFGLFMERLLRTFVPEKPLDIFMKYFRKINDYFKSFIFCQIIDGVILGIITTIEFTLIGCQYSLALGPFLGFCNLIPYFGAIVGAIVAVIIVMIADGVTKGIIVAVLLLVTQQIDGNIIQPKILSGSLQLSPVLIIISITVGGAYFGVIGMIIAIPIVTIIKNIIEDIVEYKENKKTKIIA